MKGLMGSRGDKTVEEVDMQLDEMKAELGYKVGYKKQVNLEISVLSQDLSCLNFSLGDVAHTDSSAHLFSCWLLEADWDLGG